jgi:hypothetical protein
MIFHYSCVRVSFPLYTWTVFVSQKAPLSCFIMPSFVKVKNSLLYLCSKFVEDITYMKDIFVSR